MKMSRINSYPKVYAIGHKAIAGIFDDEVIVEEKIDGSQFSMAIIDGELCCRSKGKQIVINAPEKMFIEAVEAAQKLKPSLTPGYVYRCEYLRKPKHNSLAYERVPKHNLILFDVMIGIEEYMNYSDKKIEAERLGLECVPMLYCGIVDNINSFNELLEKSKPLLGGSMIEGVVVKNYKLFTRDKKIAIGKYVSEKFKETHANEWKKSNPSKKDVLQTIVSRYRTNARWEKAVQHLRERGELEQSPRDIGNLIKEVIKDTREECEDEIKDILFAHFWPQISRGIKTGLPEWYKQKLVEQAFEDDK